MKAILQFEIYTKIEYSLYRIVARKALGALRKQLGETHLIEFNFERGGKGIFEKFFHCLWKKSSFKSVWTFPEKRDLISKLNL